MERSGIVYYKSKSCIQALEKSYICPNFLPFFGAKIGGPSNLTTNEVLPKFFAFSGAKIGGLSILTTYKILPNFFAFFWSQNWRTLYPLLHMKSCPIFLPFLKPKVEDLKLMTTPYFAQILCLFWSQKWRTFYHLLDMKCCPNVLPFWSPNWRTFYPFTPHC